MNPRSHISCSQECGRVWGNEPPHSQVMWWNPLDEHDISHCFENMGVNQRVQNFLEWMLEPCSTNMPKTKEHNELRKTSHEHVNNKKNSTYEYCNVPKAGKRNSNDPFMCFSKKSFLEVAKICFPKKWTPRMWGNIFLGNLTYNEIWFLKKCHLGKVSPWGTISPTCFFRNSTPCILKGGPHTMLAQRFLF